MDESNVDWFVWTPVVKNYATLREVETHWSIDDLADAQEVVEIISDMEERALKESK